MTTSIYVPLRWFLYDWLCAVWFVDFAIVSDALDYVRVLEKASTDVGARALEGAACDVVRRGGIFRDKLTVCDSKNTPRDQSPRKVTKTTSGHAHAIARDDTHAAFQ